MIVIAQPYANFKESIPERSLERAARQLLQLGEQTARAYYQDRIPSHSILVEVEIELGSTRAKIAISTVATVLIFYGDIRQSVEYLVKDAQYVGNIVLPAISQAVGLTSDAAVKQRRLGVPGQLHRLFDAVSRHELTPDEATDRAKALFDSYESEQTKIEDRTRITKHLSRELEETHKMGHLNPRPRSRPIPALPPQQPVVRRTRKGIHAFRGAGGEIVFQHDEE